MEGLYLETEVLGGVRLDVRVQARQGVQGNTGRVHLEGGRQGPGPELAVF